jgi:FAD/FMN-containing dehydrogenase
MSEHPALQLLRDAIGADHVHAGDAVEERHLHDWMVKIARGAPLAVVRPRTTAEVASILRICHAHLLPVVPQGGLTGLAGGATPTDGCVALSLERMIGIEEVDPAAATLTALAGTPLQTIQEAAREAGFFFPLDLGARGSCRVGGNVATNAGGNRVIRYGMTRDLVLGLEAVLADGTVVTSLNKMLKNNAGYDLKQLFIGSEGTLGVVTRVVLRLHPQPGSACTAMCALPDPSTVVDLLRHARERLAGTLSAFEMMWPDFYDLVTRGVAGLLPPLPSRHKGYVLIEALGSEQSHDQARLEAMLEAAVERSLVTDVVIAQSRGEAEALWRVRDASGEFPHLFWPHVMFDVGVPTGSIPPFVESCRGAVKTRWPDAQTVSFGHIGDSNIHFGVKVGEGEQPEAEIDSLVYGLVGRWNGSISAEHGIGLLKRAHLGQSRTPEELALMRTLKHAMDPRGILNPGKVL